MRIISIQSSRIFFLVTIAILLVYFPGCQKELKTGYGRSRGSNYTASVNGTIILDKMIKSSGRKIRHYRRISPRWYQYDTVFWIPDNFRPPNQKAVDSVEDWLESEPNKTLVYIARDYDAAIVYWDHLRNSSSATKKAGEETSRNYADSLSSHLSKSTLGNDQQKSCAWYDWSINPFQKAKSVEGQLASSLETGKAAIHYGSLPIPGDVVDSGTFNDYQVEVLLTVDSIPLVYTLSKDDWGDSKIIIVGNGSLVLNLPLSNQVNRQMMANLLETIDENDYEWGEILFIENQDKIVVSDIDVPDVKFEMVLDHQTSPQVHGAQPNILVHAFLLRVLPNLWTTEEHCS